MSYSKNVYHLIFGTYRRQPTIVAMLEKDLYAYLAGIVKAQGGYVRAINGMSDHVHIVCDLPPTISVSEFMKGMKQSSSKWMKEKGMLPVWGGWAEGYASFTCSCYSTQRVVNYVNNQKLHHMSVTYGQELRGIFDKIGISYNDRYLPD